MKIETLIKKINLKFGYSSYKNLPRESTKICINHFKNKPIDVIEVGTAGGINAQNLLKELNIRRLYLVDKYEDTLEYPESTKWKKEAHKRIKDNTKVTWIEKDSKIAVKELPKVDFIYIDGSHQYHEVLTDLESYYPLLKKGGIFAGHDIIFHQGVSNAIIKFCYEHKLNPIFRNEDWIIKEQEQEK